ncbi:hypothetical protein GQ53DRAFT_816313 [Thozetella sp. PMI_491]|nr:hypothetical protein GQ53DRAFT_816313 [Thozetella sp. PMI_491]
MAALDELDRKTGNIHNLLLEASHLSSDKTLIQNGRSMRKIMKSTRAQGVSSRHMARESQQMAMEMRKDSVSMKTIALLTMLFLPATSFAAILSMPFFAQQSWMNDADHVWLWIILTVPSTAISIAAYDLFTKRGMRVHGERDTQEEDDLSSVNFEADE